MVNTEQAVGARVESKCTKCKTVTQHLIVALVDSKPARVQCKICEGVHNYRAPATEKKPRGSTRAGATRVSRGAKTVSSVEEEWQALVGNKTPKKVVPYDMKSGFQVGDVLDHLTFGRGLVRKAIRPDTIEVHFREGIKRLRCSL